MQGLLLTVPQPLSTGQGQGAATHPVPLLQCNDASPTSLRSASTPLIDSKVLQPARTATSDTSEAAIVAATMFTSVGPCHLPLCAQVLPVRMQPLTIARAGWLLCTASTCVCEPQRRPERKPALCHAHAQVCDAFLEYLLLPLVFGV